MQHRTRIVATIGPASSSVEMLEQLIVAGMNVARLNFSHGSHEGHRLVIDRIRGLARSMGVPICILADLQGPKIRTGSLEGGRPVELRAGATLEIVTRDLPGSASRVSTSYQALPDDVVEGDRVLIDDGLIELRVLATAQGLVSCRVIHGGMLKEHKGINLPGVAVSAPALTEKDIRDVTFALDAGVDYFALSFVRSAEDVRRTKQLIADSGFNTPVLAKIEKPEAIDHLDAIIEAADAIMVARGDLGVELASERVPVCQKNIIRKAMEAGKPVITATQMLESMIVHPVPTRAEVSDVANAIFDGTGAVMLSGETAVGAHPIEAVRTMVRIAREAESSPFARYNIIHEACDRDQVTHAVAQSAVGLCHEIRASGIAVFTMSGRTADLVAKQRPEHPIFAFTPSPDCFNRLSLSWGVIPVWIPRKDDTNDMLSHASNTLLEAGAVRPGDRIVVVTGQASMTGTTNMIHVLCIH